MRAIYLRCRADCSQALANEIHPGSDSIGAAIAAHHEGGGGKLVLILDQLEAALSDPDFLRSVLAFDKFPPGADVSVVLSVREDYLARLVARTQSLEPNIPLLRLPPLSPSGASAAILGPLTEARLQIDLDLLDTLLDDLVHAAAAIGPEMGWGSARAVYPPHLQLACTVLYEARGAGEATITLEHYRKLGGFDAIVGEYLDRVLDTELAGGRDVARDLFVALVTTANERAVRTEPELLAMLSKYTPERVTAVLELLRSRGLLLRVRGDSEPSWELIHDSLVPRVLSWVDRRDLTRRRAIELVRYHLRRSRPEAPSLLGRAELRELKPHRSALDELDLEWAKRNTGPDDWTPARLVARSAAVLRRRTLTIASLVTALFAVASFGFYRSHQEEKRAQHEASLRARDLGRFTLELETFDWDPKTLTAITRPATPEIGLEWTLHAPSEKDPYQPGVAYDKELLVRGHRILTNGLLVENVEAHGGPAFLVVNRAGCASSIVPLFRLPGYAQRSVAHAIRLLIPTCAASSADMIDIAAGEFIFKGLGEPPSKLLEPFKDSPDFKERVVALPAFRIDRTEVTNAAYDVFASMHAYTNIRQLRYPDSPELKDGGASRKPAGGVDWREARAFCQYHGKQLPTSAQWTRVLRGPLRPDNPHPRRNFPWADLQSEAPAKLAMIGPPGPEAVASYPLDRSVEGVMDLAGNVTEWMLDTPEGSESNDIRVVRGGNWSEQAEQSDRETLVEWTAWDNQRPLHTRSYDMGLRCASSR